MKNDTTFVRMRSGDHLGRRKNVEKGHLAPSNLTFLLMGAIHKMAPVGVCGALLQTGPCWMYGLLREAEKNSPSERPRFAPFA